MKLRKTGAIRRYKAPSTNQHPVFIGQMTFLGISETRWPSEDGYKSDSLRIIYSGRVAIN